MNPVPFSPAVVGDLASKMLGFNLITKQTPKDGVKVKTVSQSKRMYNFLLFESVFISGQYYFSLKIMSVKTVWLLLFFFFLPVWILAVCCCLLWICADWCYGSLHKLSLSFVNLLVFVNSLFHVLITSRYLFFLCSHAACCTSWKQTFPGDEAPFSLLLVCMHLCFCVFFLFLFNSFSCFYCTVLLLVFFWGKSSEQ